MFVVKNYGLATILEVEVKGRLPVLIQRLAEQASPTAQESRLRRVLQCTGFLQVHWLAGVFGAVSGTLCCLAISGTCAGTVRG